MIFESAEKAYESLPDEVIMRSDKASFFLGFLMRDSEIRDLRAKLKAATKEHKVIHEPSHVVTPHGECE